MRWVLRGCGAALAVALIVLAAGWALSSPTPPRPERLVGHVTLALSPAHRAGPVPVPVPIMVHLWYPARQDGTPGLVGHNALFIGSWKAEAATPEPGPHPLVLFSHGSGGTAARLGWFASALAERGFVVAAPNHPGTTSGDSDPFQTPLVWQRTADLSAVLDHLLAEPPQGLTFDTSRIHAAGFSLGGHTALALGGVRLSKPAFVRYCAKAKDQLDCGWMSKAGVDFAAIDAARYEADLSDARIRRVAVIDPALTQAMTPQSLAAMAKPVLILNLGAADTLPLGLNATVAAATIPDAGYLAISGARHFSFLPECSSLGRIVIGMLGEDNICSDRNLPPRVRIHGQILTATLAFLTRP